MSSENSLVDNRVIKEAGKEALIAELIMPSLVALDFELVRVRLSGDRGGTLQIMAERPDGTMTVDDCEIISKQISPVLEVNDPIDGAYHLEVSSPGVDRPLTRLKDFQNSVGYEIKVEFKRIVNRRKRVRGVLLEVLEKAIKLELAKDSILGDEDRVIEVNFSDIAAAKIVMTEEVIAKLMNKGQKK